MRSFSKSNQIGRLLGKKYTISDIKERSLRPSAAVGGEEVNIFVSMEFQWETRQHTAVWMRAVTDIARQSYKYYKLLCPWSNGLSDFERCAGNARSVAGYVETYAGRVRRAVQQSYGALLRVRTAAGRIGFRGVVHVSSGRTTLINRVSSRTAPRRAQGSRPEPIASCYALTGVVWFMCRNVGARWWSGCRSRRGKCSRPSGRFFCTPGGTSSTCCIQSRSTREFRRCLAKPRWVTRPCLYLRTRPNSRCSGK